LPKEEHPKLLTPEDTTLNEKPSGLEPTWEMFEKIKELGVGSFGVVYLVKCI
jgi:hypothetical protein